jgi:O-antigen ligase/tetratricopeptide (TPR) repeat protein
MANLDKYLVKIIKVGLLAVLFLPLFAIGQYYFPFIFPRDIAFRVITELIFILYLYLFLSDSAYRPRFTLLAKIISGFFAVLFLAAVFGVNFRSSLWGDYERMGGLFHLFHVYLYFFVLINIFKTKDDWLNAFTFSFLISLVTSFVGLAQYFNLPVISRLGQSSRLSSSLGNASFFAAYLLLNIFFGLYLLWRREFKFKLFFFSAVAFEIFVALYELSLRWRFANRGFLMLLLSHWPFLIALIAFNLLAFLAYYSQTRRIFFWIFLASCLLFESFILFSTQTRGAVIGLYLGLVLIAGLGIFCFQPSRRKLAALLVFLLLTLTPAIIYLNRDSDWVRNQPTLYRLVTISATDVTTQSRLTTWRGSWQGLLDRPLLGWGVENYKDAFNKYFPPEIFRDRGSQLWFDRAHNIIFDVGVTSGLVGLAAYLSIYGVAFWQLFKKYRQQRVFSQSWLLVAMATAYFIQNFFVFDTLNSEVMVFLLWGFIVFLTSDSPPVAPANINSNKAMAKVGSQYTLAPLVIMLLIFAVFTYQFNIKSAQANALVSRQLFLRDHAKNLYYDQQVVDLLVEAINLSPIGRFETRQQLANYLMALNKNSEIGTRQMSSLSELAIAELKKSIAEEPQNVRNHLYLATVYTSLYKLNPQYSEAAIKLLTEAIALSPTRPQIYSERCQSYLNLKRYEEGIADCKKSLELAPWAMESHWNLFLAYVLADRDREADAELQAAKEVGQSIGNPVTLDRIISVYAQTNNWSKIIEVLESEIKNNPADANLYVKLAVAYQKLGDKNQARQAVQKAVELDPGLKAEAEMFLQLLNQPNQ